MGALPSVRNTTYNPASPILSADLNAIQDCLIGNKHPTLTVTLSPMAFGGSPVAATYSTSDVTAAPINVIASIPALVGKRITAIRVFIKDSTVGPTTQKFVFVKATGGVSTTIATSATSNGSGTNQTLSIAATELVVAGTSYSIAVQTTTGSTNSHVQGAEVDYDSL